MRQSNTNTLAALHRAALAVSSTEGDAVFRDLVSHLARALDVDVAFIALPSEADDCRLKMLAFQLDGRMIEDFEYPLAGTPCETVLGQQFRLYSNSLMERFPQDEDFRRLRLRSYAGYPLADAQGRPLGLISVAAREAFAQPDEVESLLKIFAARAVTEIERHRSHKALRESEERYRLLFEMGSDALLLVDIDTLRIVDANRTALQLYGYEREELLALDVTDLSVERELTVHSIRSEGGPGRVPLRDHRKKDGTVFPVEIATNRLDLAGRRTVLAAIRDVTARRRAEEERLQLEAQLRQAQKMEAIGHLTGGIAHDFNNILTSILGYVALAADRPAVSADAKLGLYLDQAQVAVRRARDLIQQMLTFSRGQRGDPRPVALGPLVHDAMTLMRSTLPTTVELDARVARDLPSVMLDPVHLEQVLLNLCINARDAMAGSGEIEVSAAMAEISDAVCASCRQRVRGRHVELAVMDNGPGIAPEVLDRMFEPFFTTKDVGKGSGMGLATVHGIVHEYGGHVCVDTVLGRGTTFRILLAPHAAGAARREGDDAYSASAAPAWLAGRVLVVDDEEMVGTVMREMLENWGLDATVIRNPIEAEQWFVEDPARVDLVLTDHTMPKVTGLELARRLTLLRPDLPVVLYTGYGSHVTDDEARESGICALLAKPVEPAALLSLLRAHLPSQ